MGCRPGVEYYDEGVTTLAGHVYRWRCLVNNGCNDLMYIIKEGEEYIRMANWAFAENARLGYRGYVKNKEQLWEMVIVFSRIVIHYNDGIKIL